MLTAFPFQLSIYGAQSGQGCHGQTDMASWDNRLAWIDADQRGGRRGRALFAEIPHCRNGVACAAFDDHHSISTDRVQPAVQPPLLGDAATVVPSPIAEHKNVGSGQSMARWA